MVFYFQTSDGHLLMVGKDKYENDDLIRYGLSKDVWFGAKGLRSRHVYLRLKEWETIDQISYSLIDECCQLTKAGCFDGARMEEIDVLYTSWSNLERNKAMDPGMSIFRDSSQILLIKGVKTNNRIVKALKETRCEQLHDLPMLQSEECQKNHVAKRQYFRQEQKAKQEERIAQREWSYKSFFQDMPRRTNKDEINDEENFI